MNLFTSKYLFFIIFFLDLIVYLVNTGYPLNRSDYFLGVVVHTNNETSITLKSTVPVYVLLAISSGVGFISTAIYPLSKLSLYIRQASLFGLALSHGILTISLLIFTGETSWVVVFFASFTQFYAMNIVLRYLDYPMYSENWLIPLILICSNFSILLWNALDPLNLGRLIVVCIWVLIESGVYLVPFQQSLKIERWLTVQNIINSIFNVTLVILLLVGQGYYNLIE